MMGICHELRWYTAFTLYVFAFMSTSKFYIVSIDWRNNGYGIIDTMFMVGVQQGFTIKNGLTVQFLVHDLKFLTEAID